MSKNWLLDQNQASFKGVMFEVDTDSVTGERSIVVHEYPGQEDWDIEDLGRKVFLIEVTAYVIGPDAYDRGQALLAASTSKTGPGLLILPSRPQQSAVCRRCRSTWSADAQGRIDIELEFVAVSRLPGGIVPSQMLSNAVGSGADQASGNLTNGFSQNFNSIFRSFSQPVTVPSVAREAAATTIRLAGEALAEVFREVFITDDRSAAQIDFGIRQIRLNALAFAQQGSNAYRIDELVFIDDQEDTASAFARIFSDTLRLMVRKSSDPSVMTAVLQGMLSFQPQMLNSNDIRALTVRAELALTGDVARFVRQLVLIRWAQAKTKIKYTSRADAVTAKADVTMAFESELIVTSDIDMAQQLKNVQRAAIAYLTKNGAQLPRTVSVDTARGLPAAVVAFMLYGHNSIGMDEDIWMRNGPENHPLSMPSTVEALAPNA